MTSFQSALKTANKDTPRQYQGHLVIVYIYIKKDFCTFSVFVSVLEGLNQPKSLIYGSSHWKIVHGDLPQDAFVIDDEESPKRDEMPF